MYYACMYVHLYNVCMLHFTEKVVCVCVCVCMHVDSAIHKF